MSPYTKTSAEFLADVTLLNGTFVHFTAHTHRIISSIKNSLYLDEMHAYRTYPTEFVLTFPLTHVDVLLPLPPSTRAPVHISCSGCGDIHPYNRANIYARFPLNIKFAYYIPGSHSLHTAHTVRHRNSHVQRRHVPSC